MKTMINVVSWVSFVFISTAISITSLYVAAMVCGYLREMFGLNDWRCLLLVPVLFIVGTSVDIFLMLGATKVKWGGEI